MMVMTLKLAKLAGVLLELRIWSSSLSVELCLAADDSCISLMLISAWITEAGCKSIDAGVLSLCDTSSPLCSCYLPVLILPVLLPMFLHVHAMVPQVIYLWSILQLLHKLWFLCSSPLAPVSSSASLLVQTQSSFSWSLISNVSQNSSGRYSRRPRLLASSSWHHLYLLTVNRFRVLLSFELPNLQLCNSPFLCGVFLVPGIYIHSLFK